jgi:threonine/homoserine/homoserine lactone efflux protein
MQSSLKIFWWGMLVSFLGSLPPGHMTIAATYIAGQQGIDTAWIYALGTILAEVIIVRFALAALNRFSVSHRFFFAMEIITAVLLLAMTIGCFYLAVKQNELANPETYSVNSPFTAGFIISITNPIHFAFWIGWSVVLMDKNILKPGFMSNNIYVTGIAAGSVLGYVLFIHAGEWLLKNFNKNNDVILIMFGIILFIALLLHIKKMISTPAATRYATIFKRKE